MDCTKEEDTCIDQGIMGYPTIILYKAGKKATDYKYNRDFNRYLIIKIDKHYLWVTFGKYGFEGQIHTFF